MRQEKGVMQLLAHSIQIERVADSVSLRIFSV